MPDKSETAVKTKKFITPNKIGIWAFTDENGVIWFTFHDLCVAIFDLPNYHTSANDFKNFVTEKNLEVVNLNREGHQGNFRNVVINRKGAIQLCKMVKLKKSQDIIKDWLTNFDFNTSQRSLVRR